MIGVLTFLAGLATLGTGIAVHALTLPTEFIGPDNTVLTVDGKHSIITGISDLRYTEIISGIDSGTTVYQPK